MYEAPVFPRVTETVILNDCIQKIHLEKLNQDHSLVGLY